MPKKNKIKRLISKKFYILFILLSITFFYIYPQLETPVLFIIFNRLGTTQRVFKKIRQAKPTKLFIAADGNRNNSKDLINCKNTRKIIKHVDWPCQLHLLLRDKNLGCSKSIIYAINWFFEHVEEGIILEDDCLPDLSFFGFCKQMLERYRNNQNVMMINGVNYLDYKTKSTISSDYLFLNLYTVWGWATWKRAWKLFDFKMSALTNNTNSALNKIKSFLDNDYLYKKYMHHIPAFLLNGDEIKNGAWDVAWWYTCLINDGLCITPINNLISNIGGIDKCNYSFPRKSINLNKIKHPEKIEANKNLSILINENGRKLSSGENNQLDLIDEK